jgi:tetratricopeptide (TPR) repeat protein
VYRAVVDDLPGARGYYAKAIEIFERRPPETRAAGERRRPYTLALKRLGAVEMVTGDLDASEARYRAALALEEEALRDRPAGDPRSFETTYTLTDLGEALKRRGRTDEALALWARALAMRRAAVAADAANERALHGLAALLARIGRTHALDGRPAMAVEAFRDEIRQRDLVRARFGADPARDAARMWADLWLARALCDLVDAGAAPAAAASLAEARTIYRTLRPAAVTTPNREGPDTVFAAEHAALGMRLARH